MSGVNRISKTYSYQDNKQYNIAQTRAANKNFNIFNPRLSQIKTLNDCGFVNQSGKVEIMIKCTHTWKKDVISMSYRKKKEINLNW